MTGVAGGVVSASVLTEMLDGMAHEEWYEREISEAENRALGLLHHGEIDPDGRTVYDSDRLVGVVHGAISNRADLGLSDEELFARVAARPVEQAARLDGQYLIVCHDTETGRTVIVTDKLGSRPCYYTTAPCFAFGSSLDGPLNVLDDPSVDKQAVSDMLLLGHMWGQRTLIQEIDAIPPASVLVREDSDTTIERYWHPSFEPAEPTDDYDYDLIREYQRAVDHAGRTVSGTAGIWLSGGLDSRATANELQRNAAAGAFDELVAYTYDANPVGAGNPELAAEVADTLGIDIERVPLTAEQFAENLDLIVDVTDGMVQLNTLVNLSAVLNLSDDAAGIIMEGIEGALLGHHLFSDHFTQYDDAVQAQLASEGARDVATVQDVLDYAVDPLATLRAEARRTDEDSFAEKLVDIHFQNYYARFALASNQLPRSQVGTRVPYTNRTFLEHVARLPLSYRMQSVPFTNGTIPYSVTVPKLKINRALNTSLAEIRYERTSVPATWPLFLQVAGFVASTSIARLRGKPTYGGPGMLDHWYRENDALRERVNELLESAIERDFFDANTLLRLRDEHLAGDDDHFDVLGPVSTLESWFQEHLDDQRGTREKDSVDRREQTAAPTHD